MRSAPTGHYASSSGRRSWSSLSSDDFDICSCSSAPRCSSSRSTTIMTYVLLRPRPLEIEILGDWAMFANPSRPVAAFSAILVGMLYALAPQGRARQLGKAGVVCLVAALALARLYLAVNSPSDVLIAAIIGVTVPLVAFRLLVPNEIFPVTYRRGRSAHLDVGGRRGEAIHRALEAAARRDGPGDRAVRPDRVRRLDPDAGVRQGGSGHLSVRQALRADAPARRPLVQARSHLAVRSPGGREAVQHRSSAGAAGGLRPRTVYHRADVRSPEPLGVVTITPEREYLIVTEFFDNAKEISEVGPSTRRSSTMACASSGGCGTPASPTATSSRPTCSSATARSI